ncbi:uncharacterized protein [Branchiostoma lanceolatum]|uniref:uncharacterized protein n=1 Tax=Branchiostoma lanceolatum TaxID=7740 RepID=UPI003453E14A
MLTTGKGVAACFKCKSEAENSVLGGLPGDDTCLQDVRKENPTVQTVYCPPAAQCYTKITTGFGYASAIERGCWDDYDDKGDAVSCEAGEDSTCDGNTKTGTCFKCCNTTKCNKNFAQLDGVLNGVAGLYQMCVLTLLPVAVAMFDRLKPGLA